MYEMKNRKQVSILANASITNSLQIFLNNQAELLHDCNSRIGHYICKNLKEIYFLLLLSLRSFVMEMKIKLNIGNTQSLQHSINFLKSKIMKTSALNNGIKVTAGSFFLYSILIVVLFVVKSLVPNSANMLSGDSGNSMLNQNSAQLVMPQDSDIVLNLEHMFNKKLLQVSLNVDQEGDGRLKIFNLDGKSLISANIELIKYPYYATVDVTSLNSGTYVAIVMTTKGIHSTTLIIE